MTKEPEATRNLILAVQQKDVDAIKQLLSAETADLRGIDDLVPLVEAARFSDPSIATLLLDAGAEVNQISDKTGLSALQTACSIGNRKAVELLHTRGANVDLPSTEGKTALFLAFENVRLDVIDYLLSKAAAKANQVDKFGLNPFHYAAQYFTHGRLYRAITFKFDETKIAADDGDDDDYDLDSVIMSRLKLVMMRLKDHGGEINFAPDHPNGKTPLLLAIESQNIEVAKALMDMGGSKQRGSTATAGDNDASAAIKGYLSYLMPKK